MTTVELDLSVLGTAVLIMLARVGDVTFGTMRHKFVTRDARGIVFILGFLEVIIWVYAVAAVLDRLSNPIHAVAFALGFALGNVLGITIERRLPIGHQVVRLFTRQASHMEDTLRAAGVRVTAFDGRGRDGDITLLYCGTKRKGVRELISIARSLDPLCYFAIEDVRRVDTAVIAGPRIKRRRRSKRASADESADAATAA